MIKPNTTPELWMAFSGRTRLRQVVDSHSGRAVGAIVEESSDICLIEFDIPLAH
jgi:hypothetical protein